MAHILIAEDERSINNLMAANLRLVGHTCDQVMDGEAALAGVQQTEYDLLLLDVMLPGIDGFALKGRLPAELPVIYVTAKANLADKLRGLGLGADDYIVKPFEILELLARVENVLRRTRRNTTWFEFHDLQVDLCARRVLRGGEEVTLTPQEFALLEALVINRNLALSREKLLEIAWGYDYQGETRTVDVHIQRLRRKLARKRETQPVNRIGYRPNTGGKPKAPRPYRPARTFSKGAGGALLCRCVNYVKTGEPPLDKNGRIPYNIVRLRTKKARCALAGRWESLERDCGAWINLLSRMVRRRLNATLQGLGITAIQSRVIFYILEHSPRQPVYQRDIESAFRLSRSTATGILQQLERKGILLRESVEQDARLKSLVPTARAVELNEQVRACLRQTEALLTQGLSEGQVRLFIETAAAMARNLEAEDCAAPPGEAENKFG